MAAPIVKVLAERGADLNSGEGRPNAQGLPPLHLAISRLIPLAARHDAHLETFQLPVDRGTVVDAQDRNQQTPLHAAIREQGSSHEATIGAVEMLLGLGADVNAQNSEGRTPLMLAFQARG